MQARGIIAAVLLALGACSFGGADADEDGPLEDPASDESTSDEAIDSPDAAADAPVNESLAQAHERVLTAFMACMDFEEFLDSGMTPAWSQLGTTASCGQCHSGGFGNFLASPSAQAFFAKLSTDRSVTLSYYAIDTSGGAAAAHPIVNLFIDEVGTREGPHPAYVVSAEAAAARQAFLDLTVDGCGVVQ